MRRKRSIVAQGKTDGRSEGRSARFFVPFVAWSIYRLRVVARFTFRATGLRVCARIVRLYEYALTWIFLFIVIRCLLSDREPGPAPDHHAPDRSESENQDQNQCQTAK